MMLINNKEIAKSLLCFECFDSLEKKYILKNRKIFIPIFTKITQLPILNLSGTLQQNKIIDEHETTRVLEG